jgi:hypothetical protein
MKAWGYLDAGGTHTSLDSQGRPSIAVTVAGYLATPKQWRQFDVEWKQALDELGLEYLHMNEFVARKGIFTNLKDEERAKLIPRLINIISANVIYGLGMSVLRADYDRVIKEQPDARQVLGSPYAFCAFRCFEAATDWAIAAKYQDSIKYVFEYGDESQNEVLTTHRFICQHDKLRGKYRFLDGSLTFEKSSDNGTEITPFQAADMLCWELNREEYRWSYPREGFPYTRNSLMALFQIQGEYKYYTEEELREYLQDWTEKRREFIVHVPA